METSQGMRMDLREAKGRALAAKADIKKWGDAWIVPSQTGEGVYRVTLEEGEIRCTCPDWETRRQPCKHAIAAAIVVQRTTTVTTEKVTRQGEFFQKETTTETVTETRAAVKVSYPQPDWPAYHRAQCSEKATVQVLLRGLTDGIVNPPQIGRGNRRIPLSDAVFAMVMKTYGGMSARRSTTDIEAAMDHAPRYNTVLDHMDRPELTALLTTLVEESAAPLACVESKFAVDATGFSTVSYRRWYDAKYGKEMKAARWIKAHATIGVTTNIVTAIKVTESNVNDSPELPALLESTAKRFQIGEVSADKAYLSHVNLAVIESHGAIPYVPFKSNSKGDGSAAWRRMYGMFLFKQDEFLQHYHLRSNVESTFSALKRKFGPSVRSKNPTAQVNEVLCKTLAFNLTMLVHAMHELGIDPSFVRAA